MPTILGQLTRATNILGHHLEERIVETGLYVTEYLVLRTSPAAECPACHRKDLKQLMSLSAISSEGTRAANLSAAHQRAAGVRNDRQHDEHQHLHEHFHDVAKPAKAKKKRK